MSAIPPHSIASILQGHAAQSRAAEARQRERESEAEARDATRPHPLTDAIANEDRDSSAYADAEGLGSQGRQTAGDEGGTPRDDNAGAGEGLDVQA